MTRLFREIATRWYEDDNNDDDNTKKKNTCASFFFTNKYIKQNFWRATDLSTEKGFIHFFQQVKKITRRQNIQL